MILPKATVSSQPACSTDFMLVGAYRNKIYNSIVSNLVSKSSKGYLVLRICKVLQPQHGPEIFIVNKTQPSQDGLLWGNHLEMGCCDWAEFVMRFLSRQTKPYIFFWKYVLCYQQHSTVQQQVCCKAKWVTCEYENSSPVTEKTTSAQVIMKYWGICHAILIVLAWISSMYLMFSCFSVHWKKAKYSIFIFI